VRVSRRSAETYFRLAPYDGETRVNPSLREITNAFLTIGTVDEARDFLASYGPLGDLENSWLQPDHKLYIPERRQCTVKWSEIIKYQEIIRESWKQKPRDWENLPDLSFGLHVNLLGKQPYLFAVGDTVVEALVSDLIFTALSGLPSGFCARSDCNRLFQKTTKHDRKYCSSECAHVESVRKHRARTSR
jgi:hypothetical protein